MALSWPVHLIFFHLTKKNAQNSKSKMGENGGILFLAKNENFHFGQYFFQLGITQLRFGVRKRSIPFSESTDRQLSDEHLTF